MTELEKIKYTKGFIDKLSDGINPLDDTNIPETDLLNNERISRCMAYVSDILNSIIENSSTVKKTHGKKTSFYITPEQYGLLTVADNFVFAKDISEQINQATFGNGTYKFKPAWLVSWLIETGMVEIIDDFKLPTKLGCDIGIKSEKRNSERIGEYYVMMYSPNAQRFIYDNLYAILEFANIEQADIPSNNSKPWTSDMDDKLINMFSAGYLVEVIASELGCTPTAIRARLKHLGLIENRRDAK